MNMNQNIERNILYKMFGTMYYACLFIFMFACYVFNNISYSFISLYIFITLGFFLICLNSIKNKLAIYKEIILGSFALIATMVDEKTHGSATSEIEFNRFGANIRIFVLGGEDVKIENLLYFIKDYIKKKDELLFYYSIQVVSIKNDCEIPMTRKILKKRIKNIKIEMKK